MLSSKTLEVISAEPEQISGTGCAHCGDAAARTRREFLTTSAAAAVAGFLISACGGASGPTGISTGPVALSVKVSSFPALANVGGIARIDQGGTPVAAVRTGATTFSAFSLICPHFGCTVGINGGSSFLCPCHGARFTATGAWNGGQRTANLTSLSASYDSATDVLTVSN